MFIPIPVYLIYKWLILMGFACVVSQFDLLPDLGVGNTVITVINKTG